MKRNEENSWYTVSLVDNPIADIRCLFKNENIN